MATLGDPHTDVALMIIHGYLARSLGPVTDAPTAPGYLDRDHTLALYAETAVATCSDIGFYLGLA